MSKGESEAKWKMMCECRRERRKRSETLGAGVKWRVRCGCRSEEESGMKWSVRWGCRREAKSAMGFSVAIGQGDGWWPR